MSDIVTTTNNALNKSTPTGETTEAIREKYQEVLGARHAAVLKTVEFGNMLIEVKGGCPHGSFGNYIDSNFDFTARTAQRWMKLATDFAKLSEAEATALSHLTIEEATRAISNAASISAAADKPTRKKVLNTAEKDGLTIKEAEKVVEGRARKPKAVPAEREQSGVALREAVQQNTEAPVEDDQVVGSEWEEVVVEDRGEVVENAGVIRTNKTTKDSHSEDTILHVKKPSPDMGLVELFDELQELIESPASLLPLARVRGIVAEIRRIVNPQEPDNGMDTKGGAA